MTESKIKKQYTPPKIIFETSLETKAGTPLGGPAEEGIELFPGSNE